MAIPLLQRLTSLLLEAVSGDIASPVNGQIWYNSTLDKFRKRENGTTSDMDTIGGGGGVTDGNKGDITVSSSGTQWFLNQNAGINMTVAVPQVFY